MTLPTVVNNARNKQLEAGLKRSYSLIAQALDKYHAETGERITSENVPPLQLKSMIMKYFKIAQDCGMGYVYQGQEGGDACIEYSSSDSSKNSKVYTNYYGTTTIVLSYFDDGQFVLDDGSLILINNDDANPTHLLISVDVNGYKKNPNRLGHDLFMFEIDDKGKLLPMGVTGTFLRHYYGPKFKCLPREEIGKTSGWAGGACTHEALIDKNYFKSLPR